MIPLPNTFDRFDVTPPRLALYVEEITFSKCDETTTQEGKQTFTKRIDRQIVKMKEFPSVFSLTLIPTTDVISINQPPHLLLLWLSRPCRLILQVSVNPNLFLFIRHRTILFISLICFPLIRLQ
jgi:hypothetical protein